MMEMTTEPCYSESVAKCNLERKGSLKLNSGKNDGKIIQKGKGASSSEREVMVERVSSTTEYKHWRTLEKQLGTEMCCSTEKMMEATDLSRKLPKEQDTRYSETPCKEESQHRSHKSKKQSSDRRKKSAKRVQSGLESLSKRDLAHKKHSERETKRVDPDVSSSSLVLTPHRHGIPPLLKSSSLTSHDNTQFRSSTHKKRDDSSSRSPSGNLGTYEKHGSAHAKNYKAKNKQKYFKEKGTATRQKYEMCDNTADHGSNEKTNYEQIVEMQVREIRHNLEKISKEFPETMEGSTWKLNHSEAKCGNEGLQEDTQLIPFPPSSRCCSPPPRPTEIAKYWSDADETEDESDSEIHMMHVNSMNIVLNYLKKHPEKYYRKGRETWSQSLYRENVQPGMTVQNRLTLLAESSTQWKGSKEKHVREQRKSDRGRSKHSRYPASHQVTDPSIERKPFAREHYDCHPRPHSPQDKLSHVLELITSSLANQEFKSPSSRTMQYERETSLHPLPDQWEHSHRGHLPDQREHSHRRHLPYYSLETQGLQHSSYHSPFRERDCKDRQLYSPHSNVESHSPWHKRRSLTRDSCSPLRNMNDPLGPMGSHSPSRYRGDHVSYREAQSPAMYRRLSSPSSYGDDFLRDRGPQSLSRYRKNTLRDRPESPSRYRGDSLRNRRLHKQDCFRQTEALALKNKDLPPLMSEWSPELHLPHAHLREPHFILGQSQRDQSGSQSHRDLSQSTSRAKSDYRPSLEISKTPVTAWNTKQSSEWERSRSLTPKIRQKKNVKNIFENSDYFFNPAVENTDDDDHENSGLDSEKNQIQEAEGHFTEDSSLSSTSKKVTHTSATVALCDMAAHDGFSDPKQPDHVMKPHGCDSNNQEDFSPRAAAQIFMLDDEPTIDEPEYALSDSSTVLTDHKSSFVTHASESQLPSGFSGSSEPLATQENLPGPSGVSSVTASGGIDEDDPVWLVSDSDHDPDSENFNLCLSEVTSLIAHHEAATSDNSPLKTASAKTMQKDQKALTIQNATQEEKETLTLNSAEMSTLQSLIEIAKEHTAMRGDLSTDLHRILEKIRHNTTDSENTSKSSGSQSGGDEKQRSNMSQGTGGLQENTVDPGNSRGITSKGNTDSDKKSDTNHKGDKVVATTPTKEEMYASKDKGSKTNTVKKQSKIKDVCKSQQSKTKLQVRKADNDPSDGEKLLGIKDNSKPQHSKSKYQKVKVNNKPSGDGKTLVQSKTKKGGDIPLNVKDNKKEQSLKNVGDVKGTQHKKTPKYRDHSKGKQKSHTSSVIEKTFAKMQSVRVYVGDLSVAGGRAAESVKGKPHKVKTSPSHGSPKKTPLDHMGERLLVRDSSDSSDDSTLPALDGSSKEHPLHHETIVVDHSVGVCLACKHKLVPDEYTSISLSKGTVTLRCRTCRTFTRMEKVLQLDSFIKTFNLQTSTSQKQSMCDKTSEASQTPAAVMKTNRECSRELDVTKYRQNEESERGKPLDCNKQIQKKHSYHDIQRAMIEGKKDTPTSRKGMKKLPKSVGDKTDPPKPSVSTKSQSNNDKDNPSNEVRQEMPGSFDNPDPSLCVFPWSSSRKRKLIHDNLKFYDGSSDSDECVSKQRPKKLAKRRRIINDPSTSDESDNDTL